MELKLKLDLKIDPFEAKLQHTDRCVLIGSCFSSEIGSRFAESGFDVLSNPFGTIFHPEPISRLIYETISGIFQERILQRNDLYFSWDAAGTVFGYAENELISNLENRRKQLLDYLQTSRYLFITFGSAFGYTEDESEKIVANCHKMEASSFMKRLTNIDQLVRSWTKTLLRLNELNPELQVVFTVSPVRHVKDGLIENNRSKARLFELISSLENIRYVHYFPSYEIVIDELRDYRFYKNDGIHPNDLSVDYVWDQLKATLMNTETQLLCGEIERLRKLENHLPQYSESAENIRFKQDTVQKIESFLAVHPEITWHKKA